MELNNGKELESNDNNEDDATVYLEMPLAQRLTQKVKLKNGKKKSKNETEPDKCRRSNIPSDEALDALNVWLSQKYEKENNSNTTVNAASKSPVFSKRERKKNNAKKEDKRKNVFHSVNDHHRGRKKVEEKEKCKVEDDEKSTSPVFTKHGRKNKIKSGHKRQHIDTKDKEEEIHLPKRLVSSQRIESSSEDDVIEICEHVDNPKKRKPHKRGSSHSRRSKRSKQLPQPIPSPLVMASPMSAFGRPASPATMVLVKQLEDDEMMAKRLQEEFDAEEIANSLAPIPQEQPILPRFEPQQHYIHRPTPRNQRYPILQPTQATAYGAGTWSPVHLNTGPTFDDFNMIQPFLENYLNMINTPTPPRRPRGRRRRQDHHHHHHHRFVEDENDDGNNYETLMALAERLGPAIEKGLSAIEISQLPTFIYTPDCKIQNKACSICMADYETGDNLRKLPCFHDYHDTCVDQWLVKNPACPICRVEVQI
ncbi:uncharacterized protein [Antedon mediterranea]|uniref:uncharacterized protein n=1 Tax=Antedon mediterranea TaxID=105859 RepID=UPI003AF4E54C